MIERFLINFFPVLHHLNAFIIILAIQSKCLYLRFFFIFFFFPSNSSECTRFAVAETFYRAAHITSSQHDYFFVFLFFFFLVVSAPRILRAFFTIFFSSQ